MPPPRFLPGRVPRYFKRGSEARWNASDEKLAEMLETEGRSGPMPKSIAELPKTRAIEDKLEAAGAEEMDFRLRLMADLDTCFKSASIPAGSAVVAFFFDYEGKNVVAKEPVIEASAIDPDYLQAFETCLSKAFAGKSFPREREPGVYMHAWPTTIAVPVMHHELFHWLFPEE
jgi:hypothetical protein